MNGFRGCETSPTTSSPCFALAGSCCEGTRKAWRNARVTIFRPVRATLEGTGQRLTARPLSSWTRLRPKQLGSRFVDAGGVVRSGAELGIGAGFHLRDAVLAWPRDHRARFRLSRQRQWPVPLSALSQGVSQASTGVALEVPATERWRPLRALRVACSAASVHGVTRAETSHRERQTRGTTSLRSTRQNEMERAIRRRGRSCRSSGSLPCACERRRPGRGGTRSR